MPDGLNLTRAALLGTTGLVVAAAAWTVGASAVFLAGTGLWDAFPYPAAQWWSYLPYRGSNATVDRWLAISAAAAAVPIVGIAARFGLARLRNPKPLHGTSAYATESEAERSGIRFTREPMPDAILLGRRRGLFGWRYLCLPGTDHTALYARTGSGKGVSYVIPVCLTWGGSLIAFDIKGELYRTTAGRRVALGQAAFFFAPTAPDGRSHRYNPFSYVPRGEKGCIDAIHRIMHILIPPNPKAENPFWTVSARALASGGATLLAETTGEALNPAAVLRLFARSDAAENMRAMIQKARQQGRPYPQVVVDAVLGWADSEDPRTRESVLAELKSHLSLYANPMIAAATETSDFDLRKVRCQGTSIYVGVGPADLRRLRPLLTLLFQQMIDVNTQVEFGQDPAHTHRVLMMLDEFPSQGPMNTLSDGAAFVRSYGIRMAYVMQTKAQLVSIYGQEGAENLFQNTGAEIVFGASDMKLCREVSERAGFDTVTETTRNRPRFWSAFQFSKQSESESARRRALLLPQEVARLPQDEQLVFRPGLPPLRTHRIEYFSHSTFDRLLRPAPEVPALAVNIALDSGTATHKPTPWKALP